MVQVEVWDNWGIWRRTSSVVAIINPMLVEMGMVTHIRRARLVHIVRKLQQPPIRPRHNMARLALRLRVVLTILQARSISSSTRDSMANSNLTHSSSSTTIRPKAKAKTNTHLHPAVANMLNTVVRKDSTILVTTTRAIPSSRRRSNTTSNSSSHTDNRITLAVLRIINNSIPLKANTANNTIHNPVASTRSPARTRARCRQEISHGHNTRHILQTLAHHRHNSNSTSPEDMEDRPAAMVMGVNRDTDFMILFSPLRLGQLPGTTCRKILRGYNFRSRSVAQSVLMIKMTRRVKRIHGL